MGLYAGALQVSVRHREGPGWSDELRFNETQDTLQFTDALNRIWERRPGRGRAPFKVGVVLFNLVELPGHTPDLFEHEREQSRERLYDVVDRLNRAYGKNTVYFGGAHGATGYAPMRIAFTRIPKPELEEIDPAQSKIIRPRKP
jgi:DNA polymerase-4